MKFIRRYTKTTDVIRAAPLIFAISLAVILWSWKAPAFIADDSYFYLVISKNLALDGYQTFSGIMSTNGAHPLWLYLLTAYSWAVASIFGPATLDDIRFALPLSISLLAGGCAVWWKIGDILRINQPILVLIPVIYTMIVNVLYSEMHLFFFTLSLLVLSLIALDDRRQVKWFLVGGLSALVVLSRLDAVFAIVSLAVLLLIHKRKLSILIITFSVFAAITIPYIASNYFIFGHVVPVSGYTKSTFPEVRLTLFAYSGLDALGTLKFMGYSMLYGIVPMLFALTLYPTYKDEKIHFIISMLLGGSILQFAQIALFASSKHNEPWYYLLPMMASAIAAAFLLSLALRKRPLSSRYLPHPTIVASILLILALLVGSEMSGKIDLIKTRPLDISISQESLGIFEKGDNLPSFWPPFFDAMKFLDERNIQDTTIIVSNGPGAIAFYSTSNRVVAADFLTGNVSFLDRMRNSDNALRYLFDGASQIDKPIEYAMIVGTLGDWLTPSENFRCALYLDPKFFPANHLIGHGYFGPPLELVEHERKGRHPTYFIVWDATNPRFDVDVNGPLCVEKDSNAEA